MLVIDYLKEQAKHLRRNLASDNPRLVEGARFVVATHLPWAREIGDPATLAERLTQTMALDVVARRVGYASWHALQGAARSDGTVPFPAAGTAGPDPVRVLLESVLEDIRADIDSVRSGLMSTPSNLADVDFYSEKVAIFAEGALALADGREPADPDFWAQYDRDRFGSLVPSPGPDDDPFVTAFDEAERSEGVRVHWYIERGDGRFEDAEFYEAGTLLATVEGPAGTFEIVSSGERRLERWPDDSTGTDGRGEVLRTAEEFRAAFPDGVLPDDDGEHAWSLNGWFTILPARTDSGDEDIEVIQHRLQAAVDSARACALGTDEADA